MTTDVIHSIGATNAPQAMDYTSLATWLAACPPSLVSVDQRWVGQVYNQGELNVGSTQVTGSPTTSAINKVVLCATPGASFKDHPNAATNPLRYNAAVGAAITGNVAYSQMALFRCDFETYGLQWRNSANNNNGVLAGGGGGGGTSYIHETIVSMAQTGRGNSSLLAAADANTATFTNVLSICEGAQNVKAIDGGNGMTCTNCTAIMLNGGTGAGYFTQYGGLTLNNCAVFGLPAGSQYSVGRNNSATGSNNACDQATFTGGGGGTHTMTNSVLSVPFTTATFQGVSTSLTYGPGAGGIDFRLPTGSALVAAAAAALAPTIDILGTVRPPGGPDDIGAWQTYIAPYVFAPFLTYVD